MRRKEILCNSLCLTKLITLSLSLICKLIKKIRVYILRIIKMIIQHGKSIPNYWCLTLYRITRNETRTSYTLMIVPQYFPFSNDWVSRWVWDSFNSFLILALFQRGWLLASWWWLGACNSAVSPHVTLEGLKFHLALYLWCDHIKIWSMH